MAYSELVKNFRYSRCLMREFFVYGFKSRGEYALHGLSARTYDNERRRLENWLGPYLEFYQQRDGRRYFLNVDSRALFHNPLYVGWKAKSFTDLAVSLHFFLLDLLHAAPRLLTLVEICALLDNYLEGQPASLLYDPGTVRLKLREMISQGLVALDADRDFYLYGQVKRLPVPDATLLDYFSEVAPCGVIGSYLLDRALPHREYIRFKHHYILAAMESEVLHDLLAALQEEREVKLELTSFVKPPPVNSSPAPRDLAAVVPLRIYISVRTGRQYLLAYAEGQKAIRTFRLDKIDRVLAGGRCADFAALRELLAAKEPHIWGVNTRGAAGDSLEEVEFTLYYGEQEAYIERRLERERGCGTVERVDARHLRFQASVYDSSEMLPWLRTFIGRITELKMSNKELERRFKEDLAALAALYGENGGGA